MMMVDVKKSLSKSDDLIRLWLHETARIFRDRLINEQDKNWFNSMLAGKMKEELDIDWDVDDFKVRFK